MALKQINITYNPVEDRLLLRISSEAEGGLVEYRLWLTRRFAQGLWNVFERLLADESRHAESIMPEYREALKEFQQEAALSATDFKTPYAAASAQTPLGTEPLLISKLHMRKGPKHNHTLTFVTRDGKAITLTLTTAIIHSFCKLIADAVEKTGWNIPLTASLRRTSPETEARPRRFN